MSISGDSINKLNQASASVRKLATEQKQLTAAEEQGVRLKKQLSALNAKMTPENVRLTATIKAQTQAYRQSVIEQQKLNGTFKPGVVSGFISSIKGLAAAYLGLQTAISLVKNVFETTKDLNVLSQSYKYLIGDTVELGKTQTFLSDITQRYGLELVSTSQAYLKFRASIAGANFDLVESQKIFESVSKAGSVLGLNAQRMELVFLALEQMISKGTISTEELRRQLGDNLPGAMRIMADALGVTIPKLLQMVKNNELLASEVLPKFRVQLEKAYGIESVRTVDNLQTSVNRLKNAWTVAIKEMEASPGFKAIIDFIAKALESDKMEASAKSAAIVTGALNSINVELGKIAKTGNDKAYQDAIFGFWEDAAKELSKYKYQLDLVNKSIADATSMPGGSVNRALIKEADELLIKYNAQLEILKKLDDLNIKGIAREKATEPITDETLDKLRSELNLATGIIEKLEIQKKINDYLLSKAKSGERIKELNDINKELEKQIKFYSDLGKEVDKIESINIEKQIEERNKRQQKIAKEGQDKLRQLQLDNFYDMIQDREGFADQIGLNDKEMYETELQYLKDFHKQARLTDTQYLVQRANLWIDNNSDLVDAIEQFVSEVFNMLSELNQGQIDAAQKEVDTQDDKLNDLKSKLDEEKTLKDEGKANDYDRIVTQIAETQKLRDNANKELERAQKREAAINLASQASDIITASANVIKGYSEMPIVGVLLGLAQVAAMVTAFVSYKNKINSLSKYAEGEVDINGKPHSEGGEVVEIEGGESIIKKKATQQSKRLLNAINEGLVSDFDLYKLNLNTDLSKSNYQRYDSTSEMLSELKQSRVTNEAMLNHMKNTPVIAVMPDGRLVEIYGEYKTKVVTLK